MRDQSSQRRSPRGANGFKQIQLNPRGFKGVQYGCKGDQGDLMGPMGTRAS